MNRELLDTAAALLAAQRTLHLATVTPGGAPEASVAPFVLHDGALWVYLSALASHVANLRAGCGAGAGVALVRDEAHCDEPFARPRLSFACAVSEQPRDTPVWNAVLDAFEARFGETAAVVRALPDFTLFRLAPLHGRVVAGFARAGALDRDRIAALLAG